MAIVNAAPHCQALLTNRGPPEWQAASKEIKDVCREAGDYCKVGEAELSKIISFSATKWFFPLQNCLLY